MNAYFVYGLRAATYRVFIPKASFSISIYLPVVVVVVMYYTRILFEFGRKMFYLIKYARVSRERSKRDPIVCVRRGARATAPTSSCNNNARDCWPNSFRRFFPRLLRRILHYTFAVVIRFHSVRSLPIFDGSLRARARTKKKKPVPGGARHYIYVLTLLRVCRAESCTHTHTRMSSHTRSVSSIAYLL